MFPWQVTELRGRIVLSNEVGQCVAECFQKLSCRVPCAYGESCIFSKYKFIDRVQ